MTPKLVILIAAVIGLLLLNACSCLPADTNRSRGDCSIAPDFLLT